MKQMSWRILCTISILQSSLAFAECETMEISKLQGRWVLESINEQPVNPGSHEVYFEINGQAITGFDGCNKFGGSLDAPSRLRTTQRACVSNGPKMPLELSDPRPQLTAAEIVGDQLKLPLSGGTGKAIFKRK